MATNLAVVENKPQLTIGGRPGAIVPQSMDEAYRLAKAICLAGMSPKGMETPEKCMIAIMRGMEVGLSPFQALDKIAIVNGRPVIWGDGAMSLVRGSGLCEYVRETIEGEGEKRVAICETKRKGEPAPVSRKFSVDDAKAAGLWRKAGPWTQYPERMLQMRARAFALRDVYADALGGMYLKEELEDVPVVPRAPAPPPPPPPPAIEPPKEANQFVDGARKFVAAVKDTFPGASVEIGFDVVKDDFARVAAKASDGDALETAWQEIAEPHFERFTQEQQETLLGIHRQRGRELEP